MVFRWNIVFLIGVFGNKSYNWMTTEFIEQKANNYIQRTMPHGNSGLSY
jgi:hypothetical protein